MIYEYNISKNDAHGNILERHTMKVTRSSEFNARTMVRNRFPHYKGYKEELNQIYND